MTDTPRPQRPRADTSRLDDLLPPDVTERIAAQIAMIRRLGGHGTVIIELRGKAVFVSGGERYVFEWDSGTMGKEDGP